MVQTKKDKNCQVQILHGRKILKIVVHMCKKKNIQYTSLKNCIIMKLQKSYIAWRFFSKTPTDNYKSLVEYA